MFDILARDNAFKAIFTKIKVNPQMAINANSITREQIQSQINYQQKRYNSLSKGLPLPIQPDVCKSVFSLLNGIQTGQRSYWGSNEERREVRVKALSMMYNIGLVHNNYSKFKRNTIGLLSGNVSNETLREANKIFINEQERQKIALENRHIVPDNNPIV